MTWLIMMFMLIAGAMIQTVIPACGWLGGVKIPVLLSVVLYYALTRNFVVTLAAAFFAGFLHDVLSLMPLGHSVFCFCAAGWLAGYFKNLVLTDSLFTTIIFGGIANSVITLVFCMMLLQDGAIFCSWGRIALKTAGSLLLGMIFTPVIFSLAGRLDKLVGNVEMEHSLDGVE